MSELKILISGTTGAGKTTAIRAVSEITPLNTDVRNTDSSLDKALTTTGLDYGELTLDNGEKLYLYGTPGQERFDFMWSILSRGALGVILLIDNSRPDPLADLDLYVQALSSALRTTACVVAVCRMDRHVQPDLESFARHLQSRGLLCPVVPADVRESAQVVALIELLLLQIEARAQESRHDD
ncbi:small GTP-binding protein domain [Delftia tsuruhatensis]|uniref:GTP-binding protein n=1 Tax=Delftia tsuruhatensis TaxID=180282 RepID=UPI001E743625|nr:ATP/GTP-binding protein [Delftia tsuruhatensis]CAB5700050.1 small GTP-binding protein domain [Delftia tsuruhatensis]CAC9693580.1 small GTP-binding protein domain [Delftia tsuruhatensis]